MKKLFQAIRQNKQEEVRAILEKHPEAVNSVAVPPPKKDNGQSPLQVALKTGTGEIAELLIQRGADVNFMEAEDEDPGLRCPVLHDAIKMTLMSLCRQDTALSDQGLRLVEELLKRGADPNKRASNGYDALNAAMSDGEQLLEKEVYSAVWEKGERQLEGLLDLLLEHGADFQGWADRGHFPEPAPMESNRARYLDEFVPKEDLVQTYTIRGKEYRTVIKGDVDRTARTRAFLRRYAGAKGLL